MKIREITKKVNLKFWKLTLKCKNDNLCSPWYIFSDINSVILMHHQLYYMHQHINMLQCVHPSSATAHFSKKLLENCFYHVAFTSPWKRSVYSLSSLTKPPQLDLCPAVLWNNSRLLLILTLSNLEVHF